MDKNVKLQEKEYLARVTKEIDNIKSRNNKKIRDNNKNIEGLKRYFSDNYYEIGHTNKDEYASINIQIENMQIQNDNLHREVTRLDRQKKNPYFGRFDFKVNGEELSSPHYIGLGFVKDNENNNLVYDWRADICSLYYDDKVGKTSYTCPDGEIKGEVTLKRQYKIEKGELSYYIDSSMLIDDDILMEQLSKNATTKMHDIVSTIQKEQNIMIRDNDFVNTIVQGVAGSGKTSIAMHRVSYLLFKYRHYLKSEDILILSPTEQFSDYIDEVLPAIGEESAFTTTFASMAKRLLGEKFENREEMLERVIANQTQKDFENIAIKSSFEFLEELKNFLNNDICNLFVPKTMAFGDITIEKSELHDIYFNRLKTLPVHKRIEILAENIVDRFNIPDFERPDLIKRAKKLLYNKFMTTDLLKIYNMFLRNAELEEVEKIGAYDIAPILLIKENLFALNNNFDAKYVIVDEMQDYTPCHFYLFDKIWKCSKLYLGDINQSIDKTLPLTYIKNLAKLTKSKIKFLTKSYRSTLQIALFSQKILGRKIADNVNRQGEEVECITSRDCAKTIEKILEKRKKNPAYKDQSIAIICKTNEEIKSLQKASAVIKKFKPLNTSSKENLFISTPAKAKGVEFDCVIVPFATEKNYHNELDRNLLYVASTRALHKLYFISNGKASRFLMKNNPNNTTEN